MRKLEKLRKRIEKLSPFSKLMLAIIVIWYLAYGLYFNIVHFDAVEWTAIICFIIWRKYA